MPGKKKSVSAEFQSEPTNLRRSSRSTRGSVKPIIDLAKEEEKVEAEVEDELEQDDEEYTATKTKRETSGKGSSKRESIKKEPTKRTASSRKSVAMSKQEISEKVKSEQIDEIAEDKIDHAVIEGDEDTYYELSETELKDINHAFDMNRVSDEEELLSADGLRTAIRSLGFEPRGDEIKKLLKSFSKKNNKVNRDGFHKIMALKYGSSPGTKLNNLNDEISRVFNLLDLDKTGLITAENLKAIAQELNEELTEDELHEMIREADLDGDFKINKQEFQNIMIKTSLY